MDNGLKVNPYSGEFFEEFFIGRLKPIASKWCHGNELAALDLVYETAKWFYSWQPWEKGIAYEDWPRYTVKVMKRMHYGARLQDLVTESFDNLDERTKEKAGSDRSSGATETQHLVETRSLGSKVMSLFDGDKQMQDFIYYRYFCDMTRAEIAITLGLLPRDVTDLERRFLYRVTPERAIRYLGLVPKEHRV